MNNSTEKDDSITTSAPEFQTTAPTSNLPKPFEKLPHLRDPLFSDLRYGFV